MRYTLILVLLIITTSTHAQLDAGVALEYSKSDYITIYDVLDKEFSRYKYSPIKTTIQLRYKYKRFKLIFDTHCYMRAKTIVSYKPSLMVYDVKLQYNKNKINMYLKHRCIHPILDSNTINLALSGLYTSIGISYNIQ